LGRFKQYIGFKAKSKADKLNAAPTQLIHKCQGMVETVKAVTVTNKRIDMYDVVDSDSHMFMCDGLVVHNTAAEITNASAVQIYIAFEKLGLDAKLALTVHDELCYEVRKDQALQAAKIIHDAMRSMAENVLQLPVLVEQYVNDRWFDWKTLDQPYGDKMEPTKFPALHEARFMKKVLGLKLRDLIMIPRQYVTKLPARQVAEVK